MKKPFLIMLFIWAVSACAQAPAEPSPTNNSRTPSTFTPEPSSTPEFTSTPSSTPTITLTPTATPYISQLVIKNAQIVYYDITGTTETELRNSMDAARPKDPFDGDKPVDSYTDWDISWNWKGYGTDTCDLLTVDVTYTIKVMAPRWKVPADASQELITKWEDYMQKLALHEQGHVDNVVNNYLNVKTAIQGATCSTAEAAAQNVLVELRKFDKKYDLETSHGESQGAVFP